MPTTNGYHAGSRTAGYRPSLSSSGAWGLGSWDEDEWFSRYDVPFMRRDPRVQLGLRILYAPVIAAKLIVKAKDLAVKAFVEKTLKKFWLHDLFKALSMLEWGSSGSEVLYEQDRAGRWQYAGLKDFHIGDIRPLQLRGGLWGLQVQGVPKQPVVKLQLPSCLWLANEPKGGSFYGNSRYQGAWKPWKEKRGKHGAIDIRRNWMIRCAFSGGMMRYPDGSTEVADGVYKSNQDIAREIVEKAESGHVMALPGAIDPESGKPLWEYIEPAAPPEPKSLFEYPQNLDEEILEGMGIPVEVVKALDSGSGWAGRTVPFLVFLVSEDLIVSNVVTTLDRQVMRPLVEVNYGPGQEYEIEPVSLVPKDKEEAKPGPEKLMGGEKKPEGEQEPPKATEPKQPVKMSATPETIMDRIDAATARLGRLRALEPATQPVSAEKVASLVLGGIKLATDASGHEHKGTGEGGGQFTAGGGGGTAAVEKPKAEPAKPAEPAPVAKPEPKKFGKSKARVSTAAGVSDAKVKSTLEKLFGKKKAPQIEDVASMVGAPDDASVQVGAKKLDGKDVVTVVVYHKDFTAERHLFKNAAGVHMKNDEFWVSAQAQGKGIGSDVFGRQVEQCREMGIASIRCHAAKENPREPGKPHNGYYTWPRFGYDAQIEDANFPTPVFRAIQKQFPDAETLLDVMASKEGRDWWKANGADVYHMQFDLADGSRSMRTHEAYQAERQEKKAS